MGKSEFGSFDYSEQEPDTREFLTEIADKLRSLPEKTGFKPSEKLEEYGQNIIREPEKSVELIQEWITEAQAIVDALPESEKNKAAVGLIISQAEMCYRAQLMEFGNSAFDQAIEIAFQLGLDELAQELASI
jgi:hypothetical protein